MKEQHCRNEVGWRKGWVPGTCQGIGCGCWRRECVRKNKKQNKTKNQARLTPWIVMPISRMTDWEKSFGVQVLGYLSEQAVVYVSLGEVAREVRT